MPERNIEIIPTIYVMEVTTYSGINHIKSFCLPCLARSKTNRQYRIYTPHDQISSNRVCSLCGNMTLSAAIAVLDKPRQLLVNLLSENGEFYTHIGDDVAHITIDSIYQKIIQKEMRNGKDTRYGKQSRR